MGRPALTLQEWMSVKLHEDKNNSDVDIEETSIYFPPTPILKGTSN